MNLSQVDLNLLIVLKHLLHEKHVSNTALMLNMSQPAVSRALNKLRKVFNDQLLVRSSSGYALTTKAEQIKKDLNSVLTRLEKLVEGQDFDPMVSTKTIRIFGLAPQMDIVIPKLMALLREQAPNMTLELDTISKPHFLGLMSGEHHFVLSHNEPSAADQDTYRQILSRGDFRLVMSAKHPLVNEPLNADILRNCQFGQIALQGDKNLSIEPRFKALGLTGDSGSIRVPVRLNNFSTAVPIAENTDIIFHLPTVHAERMAQYHDIVCREVPDELKHPSSEIYLYWHKRYHQDPMCIWLRSKLLEMDIKL